MPGVVRSVVGYTGGKQPNPTYRAILDHTEALLIEFDPSKISYQQMLAHWWRMHRPLYKGKCQYRSAVWYINEEQKKIAEEHLEKAKAESKDELYTSVEEATTFYRAEEYHQDFVSKQVHN